MSNYNPNFTSDEKNNSEIPEDLTINCPDCGMKVPGQLAKIMLNGKDIFCEKCGFHFTGISSKGEVKPLNKHFKENKTKNSDELSKRENEWVAWKEEWEKLKINWKSSMKEWKNRWKNDRTDYKAQAPGIYSSSVSTKNDTQYYIPNRPSQSSAPNFPPSTHNLESSGEDSKNPNREISSIKDITDKDIEKMKTGLFYLMKISPIYSLVIGIISLSIFFGGIFSGNISFLKVLGVIILQITIIVIEHTQFLPKEQEGLIPNKGLPLILVGTFGLAGYGIGAIILARGVIYLVLYYKSNINYYEGIQKEIGKKKYIEEWNSAYWCRELLISFIPFMKKLLIGYFFMGIFLSISQIGNQRWGYMISSTVFSIIVLIIFIYNIVPELYDSYYDLSQIKEEKGLLCLFAGIFSTSNGMGILLIFLGIVILIYTDSLPKLSIIGLPDQNLGENFLKTSRIPNTSNFDDKDKHKDKNQKEVLLAATGRNSDLNQETLKKILNTSQESQVGSNKQKIFDPETGLVRRFDSQTGKALNLENPSIQEEKVEKEKSRDEQTLKKQSLRKVFILLDSEVRDKFLKLNLSRKEKKEIIKEFIYLNKDQQLKYIQEFKIHNSKEEDKKFDYLIQRIYNLPLPRRKHDFLVNQLNYIPLEEQEEYILFLEEEIKENA